MQRSVIEYLDSAAAAFGGSPAVDDGRKSLCYTDLRTAVRRVGSALAAVIPPRAPVGVYMEQSTDALTAMLGAVCAGGFYSFLNPELPPARLQSIADTLRPAVILTSGELLPKAKEIFCTGTGTGTGTGTCDIPSAAFLTAEDLLRAEEDPALLQRRRDGAVDTDPLYVNFTSGSTGVPKGIAVSHRSVIDFIDCFPSLFGITSADKLANQAPFDFDVSVKDIYSCLKTGAELVIVPRALFSGPAALADFLAEKKITVMIWAVSALCLLTRFHALEYRTPETLRKILFSGEVMPAKALSVLRERLPEALFVNLYGPTEITCNCTYHILDPARDYADGIPLGVPFPNEEVFLLSEDGGEILPPSADGSQTDGPQAKEGEICVRGSALALGYYASPEQTADRFPQDPRNPRLPQRIYRTGDLGRYSEKGELFFAGRRDFQIKYMGHRIELEEIERKMAAAEGVERCCCLFDEKKSRLKGFYTGSVPPEELLARLREALPPYMLPGRLVLLPEFPLTKNGKIDRRRLSEGG